ncbi:MAG: hypothetical protein GPJ54_06730 [Candidatus Heimdallarchaeota archaeon]|nr:hypothetical protein [Candidatus Heimdallarchaeota archaeon]
MTSNTEKDFIFDLKSISGHISNKLEPHDSTTKIIEEGTIEFQVMDSSSIYEAPAFFNPVMVLNRDISILFCEIYKSLVDHKLRIIEPLAGIGTRGMRLVAELGDAISEVVINDFDEVTTQIANFNIHALGLEDKVLQFKREAKALLTELAENSYKFHYLDLDPFGPPTPFLDSLWQVLTLSAFISITATDMTALCGVYPNACLRKYGAIPLNNFHTHETAARILIATSVFSAARQGIGAFPIFTLSADHYAKVFFQTRKGRGEANKATAQVGYSYTCKNCTQLYYIAGLTTNPPTCCAELDKAGPLWTGDIFSKDWCVQGFEILESIINSETETKRFPSAKRLMKILQEGIDAYDLHGYYAIDLISSNLRVKQPKFKIFKEEMEKMGYRAVQSRFRKQSFRTDAPVEKISEIFQQVAEKE